MGGIWHWLSDVVGRLGDVPVYLLALALLLKTAESAFIGLGWRNILRAAFPESNVSFKIAWGASQGGTAINAVTPAQAGTATMIGLFRANIPGSSVAGLTSATVVQSLFFTAASVLIVIAVAIFRPRTVSKGTPADETGNFVTGHPALVAAIVLAVGVALYFLWPRLKPRLLAQWKKAKQGAAIFSDWGRYLRGVALPSATSYGCRIGVNVTFMAAFNIQITAFSVLLVASSHTLSQIFAITPGGVGQTQALDVATLRAFGSSSDIAAFSIAQDSVITIFNVVLGVVVLLWAFGLANVKQMFSRGRKKTHAPAEA